LLNDQTILIIIEHPVIKSQPLIFLTNDVLDPLGKVPELKICAVKIEKV